MAAEYLKNKNENESRAKKALQALKEAENLQEHWEAAKKIPTRAVNLTRDVWHNAARSVGDRWRQATRYVRNGFGFKGNTPESTLWAEAGMVNLKVELTDGNEQKYPLTTHEFNLKDIDNTDRVEFLIQKVQHEYGSHFPINDVTLNGKKMQHHHPLRYYGVKDGDTIKMHMA